MSSGLPHSVQVRLVQHAKELSQDPNLVLSRYATERFLYRLSRSPFAERFVLKGALLLLAWLGEAVRPTRDADLLGFGDLDHSRLAEVVHQICDVEVPADGLSFDTESIRVSPIRAEDAYGGQRATLIAYLGSARLKVQVDVGLGDVITPPAEWLEYPSLLGFPRPRLRAYRPETAVAEKVHAMVTLGSRNSRMRDFFDVRALAERQPFEGAVLADALAATFGRRYTDVPTELPLALTPSFGKVEGKMAQWAGFLRRISPSIAPQDLDCMGQEAARPQPEQQRGLERGDAPGFRLR